MDYKKQMIVYFSINALLTVSLTYFPQTKLITFKIKCLSKAAGVTRLDRLRTDDITDRTGIIIVYRIYRETANTMVWTYYEN